MRFVSLSILSLLLACPCVSGAVHDVLVHASAERTWIAKVSTQSNNGSPIEQTALLIRQSGPGEQWKTLTTVPARVVALASLPSQLVTLQSNGDWQLIWSSEGGSSGQPLPAHGQIRAFGEDGQTLWAVGAVAGGISATTEPSATEPATTTAATNSTKQALPIRLVLFQQQSGKWVAVGELPPPDSSISVTSDISLAIVAGRPIVAFQLADGSIRTIRFTSNQTWENLGLIAAVSGERIADFQLLALDNEPILWATSGTKPGRIYRGADGSSPPIDLKWVGNTAPDAVPAVAIAGGYLRLYATHGGKIYEQCFEQNWSPRGSASEVLIPTNLNDSPLKEWVNAALIVALAFSVIATLYRRTLLRKRLTELTPPQPAPLMLRGVAGFIDLLPFLATLAYVTAHQDPARDPIERLEDVPAIIATSISIAVYVLHTMLSEMFTGRSIGKWLFGLKVTSVDGAKPNAAQILIRNVLRVLDLLWVPLILVVITPLRQRSADIAAGTMVIRTDEVEQPKAKEDSSDVGNNQAG